MTSKKIYLQLGKVTSNWLNEIIQKRGHMGIKIELEKVRKVKGDKRTYAKISNNFFRKMEKEESA